jgi:hypothetical protein
VFVQNLLGNTEDMSDKKRPFIWESAYNEPSARPEVSIGFGHQRLGVQVLTAKHSCQGIFQGRLITRTFFEHIQVINTVDAEHRVQEKPIGALIYSIQAVRFHSITLSVLTYGQVHRALLYSVTGTLKLPTDKKSAEFSKTNWGDHSLVTPRGEKVMKRASVFLKRISTLKDPQWDDIFNKALAFQVTLGKQRAMAKEVETRDSELVGDVDESESDDYDLLDPRYDDVPQAVEEEL